jgi:hypothetical protein
MSKAKRRTPVGTKADKIRKRLRELHKDGKDIKQIAFPSFIAENNDIFTPREKLRPSQYYSLRKNVMIEIESEIEMPSVSGVTKLAKLAGEVVALMEQENILLVVFRRENDQGQLLPRPKLEVKEAPRLRSIDL